MMTSCPESPVVPLANRSVPVRRLLSVEAAFRGALTESFEGLALCDSNMLRFHYSHGLTVDRLADMFSHHRAAVVRRLAKIRERMLRDTRRGLAARLSLDKHELDHLIDIARDRFDIAIARILRP
jgi:hypothetical protein